MSINDSITDKAIEIIGHTDRLLQIARTSLNANERDKLYETLSRINAIVFDLKAEVEKLA
ncbi:hypothetical protein JW978_04030 [Candidatus Dojkabacteria bacterium]|nr:hypothetical protein [Candidatus Dojkabacteria bacterium]